MTEASQKLNTKALRELSIAFKPGTKPIASRANPSHPIEHRTLAYQQDFGSTKTKASPPETNSLFKWTIKVPSSWQNQSTSSLPPPISKPEVEAGISSSTEEITQTNSLFKWTIKVPSSWQNQSTSSLPPPISKPEVEAEISSSTEEITQIKRNLLTRMKMLLDAGTDTERQSPHGYTALALAALMPRPLESLLICQLFIQNGANINTAGLNGTTILMRAAARNQEHIVALLLEHGVDVAARDENGDAAWHWATKFGRSKKILEMLKEKGGCVERGEVVVLKQRRNSDETENGNKARHILPLLAEYVYSVEAPEKKHKAVGPDSAFWEEWLDMDKFS